MIFLIFSNKKHVCIENDKLMFKEGNCRLEDFIENRYVQQRYNRGCNLDIDEISLSKELKNQFKEWIIEYGKLIYNDNNLIENRAQFIEKHNKQGLILTKLLKVEMGEQFTIVLISSQQLEKFLAIKTVIEIF